MSKPNQVITDAGAVTEVTIDQINPKPQPPKVYFLYLIGYIFTLLIGSFHYGILIS